jgi:predicted nucleotidyltransferase
MKNLEEIRKTIRTHEQELREQFAVRKLAIFGSYSRGDQNESSDLDLLVEFEKPVSLLSLVSLENRLGDIIGIKVDVVPQEDVRPELRDEILSEAITA